MCLSECFKDFVNSVFLDSSNIHSKDKRILRVNVLNVFQINEPTAVTHLSDAAADQQVRSGLSSD